MVNFELKLKRYAELDKESKKVEKEKKQLNEEIKEHMKREGLTEFEHDGIKAVYGTQNRVNMNEAKLLARLEELGFTEAIEMVPRPNQKVVEDLVYQGKLPAYELDQCLERKVVHTLTVK